MAFIFQPILKKWNQETVKQVMNQLRGQVFCHMEQLKVREMEKHSVGDLMTRMTKDVDTLEEIYRTYIPDFAFALIHGVLAIVCMFMENALLAGIGIGLGLVSVWTNHFISRKLENEAKKYQENVSRFSQQVLEGEDGMVDLRMNHAVKSYYRKMKKTIGEMNKSGKRREHYQITSTAAGNFAANLQKIGMMAIGFGLTLAGKISIGSVMAVIQLNGNANYLFLNFSSFLSGVRKNLPSGVRVHELLELEEEPQGIQSESADRSDADCGLLSQNTKKVWKMSDVSYAYTEEHPVLEHKNFEIHTGEFVGIVGKSGCGKSTFLKLLLGFYAPVRGTLSLNQKEIGQMSMADWRRQIAYVSQDCYLYQMSVYNNIRLGKWNASRKEVEEACHLALADEFIEQMEQGYDTIIHENGANLSGGQKQRLALARAFLRNANLFLIDEGTAALDAKTERGITEAIEKIRKEKAVIMVSHRKEAIRYADRIYELSR